MIPLLFLGLAALFLVADIFLAGAIAFGWLGSIQLLNSIAPRFPFARWIHWIHAMSLEAFAWPAVPFLRLIRESETTLGNGKPILLVHGYMNHGSVWVLQKKRLEALGVGPIYTINLGHPFKSISHYAENVKVKAEQIVQQTGRKDLVLIGHSMGGLVSAYYATHLAPLDTVTDVITIGTPLAGTPVARIALGPNGKEMVPNSPFLKQLEEAMGRAKGIRFRHIATKSDQLVIPGASAAIKDNQCFILEDIGHTSLLYSARVTDQIYEWLQGT